MSNSAQFANFEQFMRAVISADMGGEIDPRLTQGAAPTGLNEGSGAAGGFLVPTSAAQELWSRVYAAGRILSRCDRQPLTVGDRLIIPAIRERGRADGELPDGSRFGGAQMYWTDEAGAANDSRLQIEELHFKLKKLLGLIYSTDELNMDGPALAAVLKRVFGLEAAFAIEDSIVGGDGIAKPLGVLNSPALITVAADGGQAADTVSATNLSNMASRLWGPSHASAIWLMGNEVYAEILELENTDGISLFEAGPNGERLLLQMPVELCEYTAPLGDAGDIVLADFSQYILVEKEQDPALLSSIHARFIHDESAFKLRYRVDGAPAWATPITPKNSTVTQSAFVALGARA